MTGDPFEGLLDEDRALLRKAVGALAGCRLRFAGGGALAGRGTADLDPYEHLRQGRSSR